MMEPKPTAPAAETKSSAGTSSTATAGGMRPASTRAQELLKRYDKNGDGRIDDDERADAQEAMLKERIDRQMAQFQSGNAEQFRARILERFDKNKDGKLDDEERAEAEKFGELRDELLRRFDKNGSGKLEPEEREMLQQFLRGSSPVALAAAVAREALPDAKAMAELEKTLRTAIEKDATQRARYDRNADGKLDDQEWLAARRELHRWLATQEVVTANPDERLRLERVAEEVARRRKMREEVALAGRELPEMRGLAAPSDAELEQREKALRAEIERRKKAREADAAAKPAAEGAPAPKN